MREFTQAKVLINGKNYVPMNILFLEDDPIYRKLVEVIFAKIGIRNLHIAENYDEALDIFNQEQIDLCFLDIDLGEDHRSGIDLAEAIREIDELVPFVFITSHFTENYYKRTRYTNPISFIDKKISLVRIIHIIEMAYYQVISQKSKIKKEMPMVSDHNDRHHSPKVIFFNTGELLEKFKIENINYIYNNENQTFLRMGRKNYKIDTSLKKIDDLRVPSLLRVHKSFIVNMNYIDRISKSDQKIQVGNEIIPLGTKYKSELFQQLNLYN